MAYGVELSTEVDRELDKLSAQHSKRILKSLHARVAKLDGPTQHWRGAARLAAWEFWKYPVGDYRLICKIEDDRLAVLALRIGDRKEIYR
jgi:mRNA interferase RelE/StbE